MPYPLLTMISFFQSARTTSIWLLCVFSGSSVTARQSELVDQLCFSHRYWCSLRAYLLYKMGRTELSATLREEAFRQVLFGMMKIGRTTNS